MRKQEKKECKHEYEEVHSFLRKKSPPNCLTGSLVAEKDYDILYQCTKCKKVIVK